MHWYSLLKRDIWEESVKLLLHLQQATMQAEIPPKLCDYANLHYSTTRICGLPLWVHVGKVSLWKPFEGKT